MLFRPVDPAEIHDIGGFLGRRFRANTENRLKDWSLVESYITMHERKDRSDWFWIGEQAGKWLDAAAHACVISGDEMLRDSVLQAIDRLAASQEKDGYLGITAPWHRNPVRGMQLYEWYFLIHGLLVCYRLLGSERALDVAVRLGRFIERTWGPGEGRFPLMGRFPGNGHDGGEGTLILEPMVLLGMASGEKSLITWGQETLGWWDEWADRYPESRHTGSYRAMKAVADGRAELYEVRENVHAHTLHMTLLGLAALYDATGEEEYRRVVLGCVDRIRETMIFITGGMSSGERYVPYRYYNPYNDIEVCPMHSWILLCDKALAWTGQAVYAEELERTLLNNFLAAQRSDGSNWHYMIPMNHPAQPVSTPNCCNSSGARIVGRMPVFFYSSTGTGIAINQYCPSQVTFEAPGGVRVTLKQTTDYPSDGTVRITVDPAGPARFALLLRIPSFADGARLSLIPASPGSGAEGSDVSAAAGPAWEPATGKEVSPGSYAIIQREWRRGDQVELTLPMPIRVQAGPRQLAVMRGPLVYAYFQSAQDDPARFYWHQGVYPDDVEAVVDPADPAGAFTEEPAPQGWLGPALTLKGRHKPRAPMFVHEAANRRLPGEQNVAIRLLPFVNHGAQTGHHAVFLHYQAGA